MDFFLEIHKSTKSSKGSWYECQKNARKTEEQETVSTQVEVRTQNPEARIQDKEMNKESALS